MKKYFIPAIAAAILLATGLSSCETPAGQGAGFGALTGAATGALIGAAATGTGQGAAIGAAAGAAGWSPHRRGGRAESGAVLSGASGRLSGTLNRPGHRAMSTARIRRTTSSTCAACRRARWCVIRRPAEFSASPNDAVVARELDPGRSAPARTSSFAGRDQPSRLHAAASTSLRVSSFIRTSSGQPR